MDDNNLTDLPETICNLKRIDPIGLTNNKITSLSEKILKMCKLDLTGNPKMEAKK